MKNKPRLGLQSLLVLLVCGVVGLALLVTNILVSNDVAARRQRTLGLQASIVARMVAQTPIVINGLSGKADPKLIQTFANRTRKVTGVEYVVVMDMKRIRKSHPEPEKLGKTFVGEDVYPALKGQEYTSVSEGTLGPALRAFVPVMGEGKQVGVVAVGILLTEVERAVTESRMEVLVGTIFGFLVGVGGAILLAQHIKKTLLGMEPHTIAKVLEERSAMLQSVHEGVLAVDREYRLTLVNAEAIRLLRLAGVKGTIVGRDVKDFIPHMQLESVLQEGKIRLNQELNINGSSVLINCVPVKVQGDTVGAIATFRDKTEVSRLAEELTGVRMYVEALRVQAHEFMNKLHVILGLVHTEAYGDLSTYVSGIASRYQGEIGFVVKHIKDPVVAGFILGKLGYAREQGVSLNLSETCFLPEPADSAVSHELVTILGNLIDNALEAVARSAQKCVDVEILNEDEVLEIVVADTGVGLSKEQEELIFAKGFSTKVGSRGIGLFLVYEAVKRLSGDIQVESKIGLGTTFRVSIPYDSKGELD